MHGFWHQTGLQAPAPPAASETGHLSKLWFAPLQYELKIRMTWGNRVNDGKNVGQEPR